MMSFAQRKAIAAYGVLNFLQKKGFDVAGRGYKLNKIMVAYLKERQLPYAKWNPKYKGTNTADQINSLKIKENWPDFKKWVEQNINENNKKPE